MGLINWKTKEQIEAEQSAAEEARLAPERRLQQIEAESIDTMLALTEVYETTAQQDEAREQDGLDTMLALTEAYELILQQQAIIDALTVRVEILEGGTN